MFLECWIAFFFWFVVAFQEVMFTVFGVLLLVWQWPPLGYCASPGWWPLGPCASPGRRQHNRKHSKWRGHSGATGWSGDPDAGWHQQNVCSGAICRGPLISQTVSVETLLPLRIQSWTLRMKVFSFNIRGLLLWFIFLSSWRIKNQMLTFPKVISYGPCVQPENK